MQSLIDGTSNPKMFDYHKAINDLQSNIQEKMAEADTSQVISESNSEVFDSPNSYYERHKKQKSYIGDEMKTES